MAYTSTQTAAETPNFLESEVGLVLKTAQVDESTDGMKEENGRKYIPAGTIYPSADDKAEGIIFTDTDVTDGKHAASLMVAGRVLKERIADGSPADAAVQALGIQNLLFIDGEGKIYTGGGE